MAKQEIETLLAQFNARVEAGDHGDHKYLWDRICALETMIETTPPSTLTDAAVKLRRWPIPKQG